MAHPIEADGYQVRRWLGHSPRGNSYLGVDAEGEYVAIKSLELGRLGVSPDAILEPEPQRLIQTINTASHPCVMPVRDVLVRDSTAYFIEEYLHGQTNLFDVVRRQRFIAPEAAWKLGCQLCHGLHFLHERGVTHLRLRPQTILVGQGGLEARITEAGLMALLCLLRPDLERQPWVENSICPAWLEGGPPERSCDTYSVGVILREALENGPEWNAKEQTVRDEIQRFAFLEVDRRMAELELDLHRKLRDPEDAVRWVQLRRVISEAAHPDLNQRFATAARLGKALASARYSDAYGPEPEPERNAAAEPAPARRRVSLAGAGVVFCGLCGRPATQGETNCKNCNGPLPRGVAEVVDVAEPDVKLQEVRDWFGQRGDEMAARGKSTEAERAYMLSVYREPDNASTWADLGDMYCINRKFDQALNAYHHAVHLSPSDPSLHLDLGMALLATHKPEEAQQEFTWVLNSQVSKELRLAALTQLGAAFAAQKRHQEAITLWRGVIEEKPYDVGVHCCLALSYVATHNFPRAYDHLKVAIRANPNSARAQQALRRLDKRSTRTWAAWDTKAVTLIRVPAFLMCVVFGWYGLVFYVVVTGIWELCARFDFGEFWYAVWERRRGRREADDA